MACRQRAQGQRYSWRAGHRRELLQDVRMDLDRHGDERKASIKPVSQAPSAGYLVI